MIAQPNLWRVLTTCFLLAGLAACSWDDVAEQPPARESAVLAGGDDPALRAARIAVGLQGVPYRYGGNSPSGFDCSGLVQYAYSRAGMTVPRTTREQHAATYAVDRRSLQTGDLLFFEVDGKMSHVGIYLDDGRFVHAPRRGRTVSVETLDSGFYRQAFLRGGRFR